MAGCDSVTDFVTAHPSEPYIELAKRLGDGVAAFQVEWLHFGEAKDDQMIRVAAMDSLARDLNAYLKDGWQHGAKDDFHTSSAYAAWATRLEQTRPDLKEKADLVWDTLESGIAQRGWVPTGPHDEVIVQAFEVGWPG